ncbi:hypothetical protein SLEP1_g16431 [Rubroshorea leprosula]|uniref:Uncharacterized protein n=1 Tax=Rubroshorea leprosula TaxID=152421 RepID=A0AAV5J032_9ROSI|nr:hypothetical protein SLEP1_g16431 [Rubroshorea leprosula]
MDDLPSKLIGQFLHKQFLHKQKAFGEISLDMDLEMAELEPGNRVLCFVYGLKNSVQNCLWLGLVLIAWHYLFDKRIEKETNSNALRIVTRILVCLVALSGPPLTKTQKMEEEEERIANEDRNVQNVGSTIPPGIKASPYLSPKYRRVIVSGILQKSPRDKTPKLPAWLLRREIKKIRG